MQHLLYIIWYVLQIDMWVAVAAILALTSLMVTNAAQDTDVTSLQRTNADHYTGHRARRAAEFSELF